MTIWGVIVLIIVFCLVVWLARGYIPAPANKIIIIAAAVLVIIVLLWGIGLLDGIGVGRSIRIR